MVPYLSQYSISFLKRSSCHNEVSPIMINPFKLHHSRHSFIHWHQTITTASTIKSFLWRCDIVYWHDAFLRTKINPRPVSSNDFVECTWENNDLLLPISLLLIPSYLLIIYVILFHGWNTHQVQSYFWRLVYSLNLHKLQFQNHHSPSTTSIFYFVVSIWIAIHMSIVW